MASDSNDNNKAKEPKFEWDFDVPDTPFWKDLDFRVARNFLTCYEPNELENIHFDATLNESQRLHFLLSELQSRLATRQAAVAPEKLHIADPANWQRLLLGIETLQKFLGLYEEEAETIRTMLSTMEGDARVPWLNMLADLDIRNGNFVEAESLAREVLPWMQKHVKLGVDSPQAFGTTRMLIQCLWRQGGGKKEEAESLITETSALIEGMAGSKFAKYQDEERQMLLDLKAELEGTGK
ncbi:hypothetical protein N8I77_011348 [Diaporthe amygdali]|uniref:Tetratricopeptide repeat protein n=1 Tax=Phomopsis amygdali TaxID=1214568 RepID=A0AAD9S5F3_PHOAM|nr:hypothetical protein N8I77_011348 [Diaporthe amygdali]